MRPRLVERNRQIVRLRAAGQCYRTVAREVGVSQGTVANTLYDFAWRCPQCDALFLCIDGHGSYCSRPCATEWEWEHALPIFRELREERRDRWDMPKAA